jgi:Zn-dependent protease
MVKHRAQALVAVGLILVAVWALRRSVGIDTLLVLVVVIPSIMLHEIAHGAVAYAFGDDTAKRAGRLTLNPVRHVDPIGTLILPGLMALSGLGVFGWAKPVPVNPSRMRHPRNDALAVSLAGPATNAALALVAVAALRWLCAPGVANLVRQAVAAGAFDTLSVGERLLFLLGFLNVTLAVLNLLPIPPLDGSAIVERLLPARALPTWALLRQYSMPILLVLFLTGAARLQHVFVPAERAWSHLL